MQSIHSTLYRFMVEGGSADGCAALARGGKKTAFKKFLREIDRVAGGMYNAGIRKGDAVMIALPNIEQCIVAIYAVSRIGAVAAMIHPKLSPDDFERAYNAIKPKMVFLSDINRKKFSPLAADAKRVLCPFLAYGYIGLRLGGNFEAAEGDGEETAFYLQSGGTSGTPKIIELSSRSANAMADNLYKTLDGDLTSKDVMMLVMPTFHGFGLCAGMHAALSKHLKLVLIPQFSEKTVTKAIAKNKVTIVLAIPRMVHKLLASDDFKGKAVAPLRFMFVGGDFVSDALVEAFDTHVRKNGSEAKLLPGYGLTETVTVCVLSYPEFVSGSVGKPIANNFCKVADENLMEVPCGESGELLIRGNQTMNAYLNDKEATEFALTEIEGEMWVRTGDLFKLDDKGNLYFLGRKKRLIKISGMNVFPSEIERVARELPYVKECVATEYESGGKTFIKLIVEGNLSESQKKSIMDHVADNLSHWNIPKKIECAEVFPRTNIGKIDFVRLCDEHREN